MRHVIRGCFGAAAIGVVLLAGGGFASAASVHSSATSTNNCPITLGSSNGQVVVVPSSTGSTTNWDPGVTSSSSGQLAFTGTDVGGMALVGGGLLGGGLLFLRASKLSRLASPAVVEE